VKFFLFLTLYTSEQPQALKILKVLALPLYITSTQFCLQNFPKPQTQPSRAFSRETYTPVLNTASGIMSSSLVKIEGRTDTMNFTGALTYQLRRVSNRATSRTSLLSRPFEADFSHTTTNRPKKKPVSKVKGSTQRTYSPKLPESPSRLKSGPTRREKKKFLRLKITHSNKNEMSPKITFKIKFGPKEELFWDPDWE
jgi:hypothetical protein